MLLKTNTNLANQIYIDLKKKIEHFDYKPGDRISEVNLAKTYNVSRTPIKNSLSRLENDNIVFVRPQIGTFVSKIDTKHIHEFFTIRKLLEIAIINEVKNSISSEFITKISQNLKNQKELLNLQLDKIELSKKFWELDNEFHELIFTAVNKKFVWDYILSQSSQFNRFRLLSTTVDSGKLSDKIAQHEKIFDYINSTTEQNFDIFAFYDYHLFNTLDNTILELKKEYPKYFE